MTATLKCFAVSIHFEGAVAQTMILAPDSGLAIAMGTAAAFKSEGAVGDIVGVNAHEVELAWLKRAVAAMEGEKPPGEVVPLSLVTSDAPGAMYLPPNEKHRPTLPQTWLNSQATQASPAEVNAAMGDPGMQNWQPKPPDGSAA